jgi:hypothetical protein
MKPKRKLVWTYWMPGIETPIVSKRLSLSTIRELEKEHGEVKVKRMYLHGSASS